MRTGYVLKVFPRYSETFVANEIIAHEAAGLEIDIFALRPKDENVFFPDFPVRAHIDYVPHKCKRAGWTWRIASHSRGHCHRRSSSIAFAKQRRWRRRASSAPMAIVMACRQSCWKRWPLALRASRRM